jgi:hypothetical protein
MPVYQLWILTEILVRQITPRILGLRYHHFLGFKLIQAQNNINNELNVEHAQPEGAGENIWTLM